VLVDDNEKTATAEVELLAHSDGMFTGTGCRPQTEGFPGDSDRDRKDREAD